jgi:hypothetical protein
MPVAFMRRPTNPCRSAPCSVPADDVAEHRHTAADQGTRATDVAGDLCPEPLKRQPAGLCKRLSLAGLSRLVLQPE